MKENENENYEKKIENEKGNRSKNLFYRGINILDKNKTKEQILKENITTYDNKKGIVNENNKRNKKNGNRNIIESLCYKGKNLCNDLDENKWKGENIVESFRGKVGEIKGDILNKKEEGENGERKTREGGKVLFGKK